MEEIKVGEYIRTTEGCIVKIKNDEHLDFLKFSNAVIGNIVKHSENIIDLIETGDIVNGYKVVKDNLESAEYGKYVDVYCPSKNLELNFLEHVFPEHIKTILTHEQYEQNCYKVGVD